MRFAFAVAALATAFVVASFIAGWVAADWISDLLLEVKVGE